MNVFSYLSFFLLGAVAVLAYMWRDTFDAELLTSEEPFAKGSLWRIKSLFGGLVTGASKGIGEQMAYHYARFGAKIVITARGEDGLKKKCVKLGALKVSYVTGDMSDPADPDRVIKYALDKLGGLDYLVLNHVGNSYVEFWNRDSDHIRTLMQVNFVSYVQLTAAALPVMEKSRGSIIVISSVAGKLASSTKFAVNGFFNTLQHKLAIEKSNVSVTIMILGLIDTETAMNKIKGFGSMTAYPAGEAALSIIKAGATRQREAFYPWFHYFTCLFRDWFPFIKDLMLSD